MQKINGSQTAVNNGRIVSQVTLAPLDGLILLPVSTPPPGGNTASMVFTVSLNGKPVAKPGPLVDRQTPLNWAYQVRNTGDVTLNNVIITGRQKYPIFGQWGTLCSIGSIQPGTTGRCEIADNNVTKKYIALVKASSQTANGKQLQQSLKVFYRGESNPPAAATRITLKNAIYFRATEKLWIRAQSSARPRGSDTLTATVQIQGVKHDLGAIRWKAGKGFYQQVFLNIKTRPTSITLSNDQGVSVTSRVIIR